MATKQVKMTPAKQPEQKGGKGGGTKGGKTNEQLLKLGRSAARAAADGKAY